MTKRVLALLIAVTMIVALATACKKPTTSASSSASAKVTTAKPSATTAKPSGTATTTGTAAPVVTDVTGATIDPNMTAAPTVTAEPPPAETINPEEDVTAAPDYVRPAEPEINLQGRTVVFRGHYGTLDQYKRLPTGDPANGIDILYNNIQNVQNRFNFKFEFQSVVSSGWRVIDAFIVQASAGADWSDIVWNMSRMAFPTEVYKNLVVPIDTLFDFQRDPVYSQRFQRTQAEWEGRIYGLGAGLVSTPDLGMFYNEDIIKAMGFQDPIDLYNQGNWTWETFFDMAVQATRDFDNDGIIDQYGLNGDIRRVYQGLICSNGASLVEYKGNGQYELALEKPAAMRALIKLNDVMNVLKIVKPETFLTTDADPSWGAGKSLFLFAGLPGHITGMRNAAVKNVRWMSLPRGPDAGDLNLNMIRETNYFAWTTTIGPDWKEVVIASSWLFTAGFDWIRYPNTVNKAAIFDKQAWIVANRPGGYYDEKNLQHIAELTFDQGTRVIKWPAWSALVDDGSTTSNTLINKTFKDMYNGVPVVTALDQYRDLYIAEMNDILNYR